MRLAKSSRIPTFFRTLAILAIFIFSHGSPSLASGQSLLYGITEDGILVTVEKDFGPNSYPLVKIEIARAPINGFGVFGGLTYHNNEFYAGSLSGNVIKFSSAYPQVIHLGNSGYAIHSMAANSQGDIWATVSTTLNDSNAPATHLAQISKTTGQLLNIHQIKAPSQFPQGYAFHGAGLAFDHLDNLRIFIFWKPPVAPGYSTVWSVGLSTISTANGSITSLSSDGKRFISYTLQAYGYFNSGIEIDRLSQSPSTFFIGGREQVYLSNSWNVTAFLKEAIVDLDTVQHTNLHWGVLFFVGGSDTVGSRPTYMDITDATFTFPTNPTPPINPTVPPVPPVNPIPKPSPDELRDITPILRYHKD